MNTNSIFKGDSKIYWLLLQNVLIGSISGVLGLKILMLCRSASTSTIISIVGIGIVFCLAGLSALVSIFNLNSIVLYDDCLIIKSIFGNTKQIIHLKDIMRWEEIERHSRRKKWKELTLYSSNNTEYTLHSDSFYVENYQFIRKILTQDKPEKVQLIEPPAEYSLSWSLLILGSGIFLLWLGYYLHTQHVLVISTIPTVFGLRNIIVAFYQWYEMYKQRKINF
jgi:hypothetical protein